MTIELISETLSRYAEKMTTPETASLAALNRQTSMKVLQPQMLSGHLQGSLLAMISHMVRPRRVLEVGTYTGYSAICLAAGLAEDGQLHTVDINEELADMCRQYWEAAGVAHRITHHIGMAAEIIPALEAPFDLVFIDADKVNYGLYYDQVIDKVRPGGVILADNVLYEGEVTLPEAEQSKQAKAIHAFNSKVKEDPRVEQVLLPVRDGLLIIRKTGKA